MRDSGMARPEGFEPPTDGFEGHCSIQLSYERINIKRILSNVINRQVSTLNKIYCISRRVNCKSAKACRSNVNMETL
jgi:hypothetical protein